LVITLEKTYKNSTVNSDYSEIKQKVGYRMNAAKRRSRQVLTAQFIPEKLINRMDFVQMEKILFGL
jgi:hypothetical protein